MIQYVHYPKLGGALENYITARQVEERWPFLTVTNLAQLRFTGKGPRFLKPTPRTVVYRERDIIEWLEASERTSTAQAS